MSRASVPSVLLALALGASAASGQSCPTPEPSQDTGFLEPLWGGELRHVHSWHRPAGQGGHDPYRLWTTEDGGRIRYHGYGGDLSVGTWRFQETPADVGGTLLDVWFLEDGLTGWACGRGGSVLVTSDAGWSGWQHVDPSQPVLLDADGDPATIWRTRWFTPQVGLAAGVKLFKATVDGGLTWFDLELFADAALSVPIPIDEMRLYALDLRGALGTGWVGGLAGRRVQDVGGSTVETGLVFHTDSTVAGTSLGRKWWVTLDDSLTPSDGLWPHSGPGDMREPWDLAFERDSTALPHETVGYVVGGRGVGNPGRIFRTTNGGLSWIEEAADPTGLSVTGDTHIPTLYGVGARVGFAVAAGYAGHVWVRDPGSSLWRFALQATAPGDWYSAPIADADAIHNPNTGRNEGFVSGSFGFLRASRNGGLTFASLLPAYQNQWEQEWRVRGLAALDDLNAFVTGQIGLIARTQDGGCTWDLVDGWVGQAPVTYLDDVAFEGPGLFGVAVGDNTQGNGLRRSADGGATWSAPLLLPVGSDTWQLHDVDHVAGLEFWAVGQRTDGTALFVRTTDGGQVWQELSVPTTPNTHFEALAVVPATGEALVVGRRGGAQAPRAAAWTYQVTGGVATHQVVYGPQAVGTELFDVALKGDSLLRAEAFASGRGGVLLTWTGSTFGDTPGAYVTAGTPFQLLQTDLTSVSMAPGAGSEVLVTADYPVETFAPSADVGFHLRRRNGQWATVRSWLGYQTTDAELVSDGVGFVVGTGVGVATVEGGSVADGAVARYDDP